MPKIERICKQCGEVFERIMTPSQIKRNPPQYCSKKCADNARGGKYTKEYKHLIKHGKVCKCGCGGQIIPTKRMKYNGVSDYIWGHSGSGSPAGEKHPMFGKHHTEEARKKISEALKGKYIGSQNYRWGKHPSAESKKKMSAAHKGKYPSPETRRKMSAAKKGEKSYNWKGGHEMAYKRRQIIDKKGIKTLRGKAGEQYIKKTLIRKYQLGFADISQELVNLKREQIKLSREIRNVQSNQKC